MELSPEIRAAIADRDRERDIADLKAEIVEMHKEIEAMKAERDKALKWGIATLGGIVMTLAGLIFGFPHKP